MYGLGVVILKNNEVIKIYSEKGKEKILVSMRNVVGEIEVFKIVM